MANLRQFRPGQSGNPNGRPSAGLSVKEWLNQMQDWPLAAIKAVLTEPDARANKVAAARIWDDACSSAKNSAGMPVAGGDIDRIFDRTNGKPVQAMEVSGPDGGPIETMDLSKLTPDDLRHLREIRMKAEPAPSEN